MKDIFLNVMKGTVSWDLIQNEAAKVSVTGNGHRSCLIIYFYKCSCTTIMHFSNCESFLHEHSPIHNYLQKYQIRGFFYIKLWIHTFGIKYVSFGSFWYWIAGFSVIFFSKSQKWSLPFYFTHYITRNKKGSPFFGLSKFKDYSRCFQWIFSYFFITFKVTSKFCWIKIYKLRISFEQNLMSYPIFQSENFFLAYLSKLRGSNKEQKVKCLWSAHCFPDFIPFQRSLL